MKVLITDGFGKKGQEMFEETSEIEFDLRKGVPADEVLELVGDYDALIVRSATKVTKEVIDAGKNLKVIGRAGAGVDNIDVEYATEKGIWVENTPGANSHAVAELTVAKMFALARFVPAADQTMKEGKWAKKTLKGTELKDKTLGVIGLGKIGKDVACMCNALGMKVISYDPVLADEDFENAGIEKVNLNELYERSDYITIHVPVNDSTKDMINSETISKMKDGVRIINCARGGIVNESDLAAALESGKVSGAGVDVYSKEPAEPDNPLLKAKNIVLSPHIGASTEEAQENVSAMIAEQIIEFAKTKKVINAVNKLS